MTRPKYLYKTHPLMMFNHQNHEHQKMENKFIPPSQPSLGFFGILRESFKTTSKNGKLLVPILLLAFLSLSQLDFAQNYLLTPVVKDFTLQLANHPNMAQDLSYNLDQPTYRAALNDIKELLLVKILILVFSSIISLVFVVATVSSSSEAYTAKVLGPKDMFLKIRTSLKNPLDTSVYMILITLGISCLYFFSIGLTSIFAVNSWAYLFLGVLCFSVPVCYLYVAALWMVSVVISVLDGVGGVIAIGRAAELLNGKRVQASLLMVPFAIAYVGVHLMANTITSYSLSRSTQLAISIPLKNGLVCMLKLFMFVVYTVFYHERKRSHDEKEVKGFYLPVAAEA